MLLNTGKCNLVSFCSFNASFCGCEVCTIFPVRSSFFPCLVFRSQCLCHSSPALASLELFWLGFTKPPLASYLFLFFLMKGA